jgi:septum formation inhibitor MinC
MENNYELLKNHLLSIKGDMTPKIEEYLDEKSLIYILNRNLPVKKRTSKDICIVGAVEEESKEQEDTQAQEKRVIIKEKDIIEKTPIVEDFGYGLSPLKVLTKPLRSGQVIQHDGAVLIMDRVNSGAKIAALGSVIALGIVEGDISSTGECLVIPRVKKGNIFFHGYRIDLDRLVYPLNKLIFLGDRIVVQAISKKELI